MQFKTERFRLTWKGSEKERQGLMKTKSHRLSKIAWWWASRLLPCPGYYKQCCDEHWGAHVSFRSGFLGVYKVISPQLIKINEKKKHKKKLPDENRDWLSYESGNTWPYRITRYTGQAWSERWLEFLAGVLEDFKMENKWSEAQIPSRLRCANVPLLIGLPALFQRAL